MRTFVTGAGGMLAHATLPLLGEAETTLCDLPDCDITDREALLGAVLAARPGRILHFAAFTDVDGAEGDPDGAMRVNALGTENVARAAAAAGAQLVAVSTDYVFDGSLTRPLEEDDPVGPASVYGRTKLEGETRARRECGRTVIVRTAWLFGPHGKNFVDTIAARLAAGDAVCVVDDQVGRPTYTADLARGILELAGAVDAGVYHLTNGGTPASWFDVANEVAACVGADPGLVSATTTEALGRPAPRPAYSVLDNGKAERVGVRPLRDWREAVAAHLGVG